MGGFRQGARGFRESRHRGFRPGFGSFGYYDYGYDGCDYNTFYQWPQYTYCY
jgi:hypothetical protein